MDEILKYVSKDKYKKECTSLKDGEFKTIFNNSDVTIDLFKSGRKIYKFIAYYGDKHINECVKNIALIQA